MVPSITPGWKSQLKLMIPDSSRAVHAGGDVHVVNGHDVVDDVEGYQLVSASRELVGHKEGVVEGDIDG